MGGCGRRAGAGSSAAGALMSRAAMLSAQAWGEMTMAQPLAWA